jgi:hypothetical protein
MGRSATGSGQVSLKWSCLVDACFLQVITQSPCFIVIKSLMYLQHSEEKRKGPTTEEPVASLALPNAPEIESFGIPHALQLHPVCGPGSAFGRSLLHKAVCEMDINAVQTELSSGAVEYMEQRDTKGYCPMHSACALCMFDPMNSATAGEIVRLLIAAGADASIRDLDGNTPLHWASRAGDRGTAELLLLKNNPKGMFQKIA